MIVPQPISILFLYTSLETGGAERQLASLVERLDRARFRPIVAVQHAVGRIGEELVVRGIPVHALSDRRRFDAGFLRRTRGLMRAENVQLVMTHGFSTGVVARLAGLLGGPPVRIVAEHTVDERDMNPWKHAINRLLRPWTTAWVAVTETQRGYLRGVKRLPEARLHIIHNGIDVTRAGDEPGGGEVRARVREELGLPENAPVVGCVAVLRPEKDLHTLVGAMQSVVTSIPEARLVLVGDGPERARLRQEILARGLEHRVSLAGHRDDVTDVLSAFDVVVSSSLVEALPMAVLEAMAASLPVVATRVGAMTELVEPEHNGLLVPKGDAPALALAITRVLGDLDTARTWGAASRRRVVERYEVNAMVRAYETLFTELLTKAHVGVPPAR